MLTMPKHCSAIKRKAIKIDPRSIPIPQRRRLAEVPTLNIRLILTTAQATLRIPTLNRRHNLRLPFPQMDSLSPYIPEMLKLKLPIPEMVSLKVSILKVTMGRRQAKAIQILLLTPLHRMSMERSMRETTPH